jgi:hypothetical protein
VLDSGRVLAGSSQASFDRSRLNGGKSFYCNDVFVLFQKVLVAVSDRNVKALLHFYRATQSRVSGLVLLRFRPYEGSCTWSDAQIRIGSSAVSCTSPSLQKRNCD